MEGHKAEGAHTWENCCAPRNDQQLAQGCPLGGRFISSIRSIDLRLIDDLVDFVRGPGFVLDFSDTSFADFFASELKVNIDDPKYAANGGSKGKRLRYFLQSCDDATAVRALTALWEHRGEYLARSGGRIPSPMPRRAIKG